MQILKKYTKIYQKYREVIDSISFNREDTQILMMVCLFCKRYHLLEQCCLFNPMKKNVLLQKKKKYNKNETKIDLELTINVQRYHLKRANLRGRLLPRIAAILVPIIMFLIPYNIEIQFITSSNCKNYNISFDFTSNSSCS